MTAAAAEVDHGAWLARWDAQQAGYVPHREARFAAMLDVVEALAGATPRVLDLAAGPGSASARVLDRLPQATCVALDVDPVLTALGRGALGEGPHLTWVDADLRDPTWTGAAGGAPFDAILTTTALHWLGTAQLLRVYADCAGLLRPGGVLLNGDHLPDAAGSPALSRATTAVRHGRRAADRVGDADGWDDWWTAITAEPGYAEAVAERARRRHEHPHDHTAADLGLHVAGLRAAGFREVGVVWSVGDDRVLAAVP